VVAAAAAVAAAAVEAHVPCGTQVHHIGCVYEP